VSHDRYFMDHLVDQLFVFEGDGNIRLFNGNYSDYRDWLDDQQAPEVKPAKAATPAEPVSSPAKKKLSYKEKQEFDALSRRSMHWKKEKPNWMFISTPAATTISN